MAQPNQKNDVFLQAHKYNPVQSCVTKLIPFELTWTIDDIDKLSADDLIGNPVIHSPPFNAPPDKITTADKKPVQFEIDFYPKGISHENPGFVSMYLTLKNHSPLNVMFTFSIVLANGERHKFFNCAKMFVAPEKHIWGKSEMMPLDQLYNPENHFVRDGKLVLHCEVNIIVSEFAPPDLRDKHSQPEQVINSLADLLESGDHSDVTLVMVDDDDGVELRAHKSILVARSKVFAEMFSFEMAESTSNRVEIQDVQANVFKQVLQYIYTGRVPGSLDDTAEELLSCADKYQLDSLKSICEEYLCSEITQMPDESVTDLLFLAYVCGASKLKKAVQDFKRKELIRALEEDPEMAAQILLSSSFADKQDRD